MPLHYIYGLADPFSHQLRYIGQTNNLLRRYNEHIEDDNDTPKCRWIKSIQARGQQPVLVHLDTCEEYEIDELEPWWIQLYAQKRWPLTNSTFAGVQRAKRKPVIKWRSVAQAGCAVAVMAVVVIIIYLAVKILGGL